MSNANEKNMPMANKIIERIKKLVTLQDNSVALHQPCFMGNEWHYVKECLDTGWVSSVGKFVDQFERDLENFTGSKFAIATSNGTSALHICAILTGITAGDEVLVPTLTFIGTINPILYCGAFPHFIDAEENTLGINPILLENYLSEMTYIKAGVCFNRYTDRPIRALCVMHTLGHPVDLDPLLEICNKYSIKLIEDAAEALGSYYKGKHVGQHGLVSALSFNGNKIITTGGGGAVLTSNVELAKRAKHITTTAKLPHAWAFEHDQMGYNYRLPNINAALGCAQLEQLTKFLEVKRVLAEEYHTIFADLNDVRCIKEPFYAKSNYWLNAILLDNDLAEQRDNILDLLNKNGIMTRPLWNLQHTLSMHKNFPHMPLPVAESLLKRLIKIPSSANIGMSIAQNRQKSCAV